ncbi:MAG TPA: methylmalonyl-CoA mutase subunit beta [Jatrophihabitans sp.]|nr:methylmalonyl-CoA mutase subunit beta [Jatrophihabitans sp.]
MPTAPDAPPDPAVLPLAADFPPATRDQWRTLVTTVLARSRGSADVDPEQALTASTYDGIEIRPLYTAADAHDVDVDGLPGLPPFVRGATAAAAGWLVCTRHDDPDPKRANRAVVDDLERGATAIWLVLGAGGLRVDDLEAALNGVYLDLAPIILDAGADAADAAAALLGLAGQRGVAPAALAGSLGADPIGARARTGAVADLDLLAALAELRGPATQLRIATVDGTVYHDAGASDAQELGIATAVGVAYLRALTAAGLSVDEALAAVDFRWATTAEQFPSIAKLRAARRIWNRVAELCGAPAQRRGQWQHAVTSAAMMTQRDPWVNMLRTTIACFAAAVGGADAITVAPFDAAIGESDDFARRIARNTQAIVHDESSLARVLDAAGGSWFVESLTDQLAAAGWDVFTEIERAGGALKALDDELIGDLALRTRAARAEDIAHRRAPITGVSEFAFVDEAPVVRPARPTSRPTGLLLPRRYAEDFEALRDRSDAARERPTVHLITMGAVTAWSARAGFAANLFQAGGVRVLTGTVDEFPGGVACVCGPDRMYADEAVPLVADLRRRGATFVWLAGRGDYAGVDGYLYTGCDALAVLRTTLDALGVGK